jgi:hypothetical protein
LTHQPTAGKQWWQGGHFLSVYFRDLARAGSEAMMEPVTVLGAMSAGMAAMTGALTVLWRRFEKLANDCEEDRRQLWKEIAEIKGANDKS